MTSARTQNYFGGPDFHIQNVRRAGGNQLNAPAHVGILLFEHDLMNSLSMIQLKRQRQNEQGNERSRSLRKAPRRKYLWYFSGRILKNLDQHPKPRLCEMPLGTSKNASLNFEKQTSEESLTHISHLDSHECSSNLGAALPTPSTSKSLTIRSFHLKT